MYSCPGCGSQMVFDIPTQGLKCGRCDRTMTVQEADEKEAVDIDALNQEIERIVKREIELRTAIDAIIKELSL